jgi:uncharacterized repeat protein (TIGR03803 family)
MFPHSNPTPDGRLLYGLTSLGGTHGHWTMYQLNTDGTGYTVLHSFKNSDGTEPRGFVIVVGHDLYGMTRQGDTDNDGSIFRFDLRSGKYTVLHQFTGG